MIASRNGTTSHSACLNSASSNVVQESVVTHTSGPDDRYRLALASAYSGGFTEVCGRSSEARSRSCRPSWRASCSEIFDAITAWVSSRLSKSPRDSDASTQSSAARACAERGALSSSASSPNTTPASISAIRPVSGSPWRQISTRPEMMT